MKCKYCNAEVAQNARFCTTCGKDLSIFDKCVNCGELIESNESVCPHCGAEQPPQKEVERNRAKKWLCFVLIVVVVLTLIGGGYWFYSQAPTANQPQASAETDSIEVTTDSYDIHSVDGIKARLNDIFTKALNMPDDAVVSKYFSQDFKQLYNQVEKIDATLDGPGFWNGSIWDGRQDNNPNTFEIVRISISSPTDANFDVNLIFDDGNVHSENKVSMSLLFEDGNWYIDDNLTMDMKNSMREYIKEDANNKDYSTFFVDKIFKGGGNGGGNGIEMTISFLDNNQCLCESDWYRAYSSPKTCKGTYSVDGEKVVVRCKVDDIDYEFDFNIRDGGSIISFSHSDPEMEGSMRNDFMSLELQNR